MSTSPHPYSFPSPPVRQSAHNPNNRDSHPPASSHQTQEDLLAHFRASATRLSTTTTSPPSHSSYYSDTTVDPLPSLPDSPSQRPITKHHLPSRLTVLTPPLLPSAPSAPNPVPVPVDNFAAPRGDSPLTINMGHRANNDSQDSDWTNEKHGGTFQDVRIEEANGRPSGLGGDGESRHRFTLGDEDSESYSRSNGGRKEGGGMMRGPGGGASGWEKEGGRRKVHKRMWWCLVVLLVGAVAIGVGVGVSRHNANSSNNDSASKTEDQSTTSDSDSSTAATISSSSRSTTSLPSATATSTRSTTSLPLSTSTRLSSTSTRPLAASATKTYSTSFTYAISSITTAIPLTYTIPTSYDTRLNGDYQFTEEVVMTDPSNGQRFTSSLRFRVRPTEASAAAATTAGRRHRRDRLIR